MQRLSLIKPKARAKGDGFDKLEELLHRIVLKASNTQDPSQEQLQSLINLYNKGQNQEI